MKIKINKWEKFGFLYNLSNNKKKKCSELYDIVANILLKQNHNPEISTFMFPIIRRLVDGLSLEESNKINVQYLINDINEKISLYNDNNNNLNKIDVEAEFCASYVKEYIEKQLNNNNEIKYYTYGFECSNINNLKTNKEKDIIYNKILNQFQEQLKKWIYE